MVRAFRPAVALVAVAAFVGGCSGGAPPGGLLMVPITVRNFAIDAPGSVRAGPIRFEISGGGPSMHEFNVARTSYLPDALPLTDGGVVDDLTPHDGFDHLAEAEGIDIGTKKHLDLNLSPGTYVLYCNMDGHYQAGMSVRLTVTP